MNDLKNDDYSVSIRAEQHVLGALLVDNDALDRIADLEGAHFYCNDHRLIFDEIRRQVVAGHRCDPMTLMSRCREGRELSPVPGQVARVRRECREHPPTRRDHHRQGGKARAARPEH